MKISFVFETKPEKGEERQEKGWNGFVWSFFTKKKEKKWISELVGMGDGVRRELSLSCASPRPHCPVWQPPVTHGY